MAVRTITCLPAVIGAWRARRRRRPAQHQQALSLQRRRAGTARPDSARHAHHQHGAAGRGAARRAAGAAGAGPVRLQLQPRRGLSRSGPRARRACGARTCSPSSTSSSRPTPPTTPTSCCRRRRSWSTSTSTAPTAICTCRPTSRPSRRWPRRRATTTSFACWPGAMGFEPELFEVSDEQLAAEALQPARRRPTFPPRRRFDGITLERLQREGPVRLNLPTNYAPFAEGGFGTPSGKCELYSPRLAAQGLDPLPTYTPPHEDPQTRPDLAARYPLQMLSPPVPSFLNSTFVNVDSLRQQAGEPTRGDPSRRRRSRAASQTASGCASSTTAAASRRGPWSARRSSRASSCRRASGGTSTRRTASTATRRPAPR